MKFNLFNDTADFLVKDDPPPIGSTPDDYDVSTESDGSQKFETDQTWSPCCTDGFVIGQLDGLNWSMLGEFGESPSGINSWKAVSSDGATISLQTNPSRAVKLEPVPEPGTMLLVGFGLLGLLGYGVHRKKKS